MPRSFFHPYLHCLLLIWLPWTAAIADSSDGATEFFESKIRPLLIEHCYECHNSTEDAESNLAVDWRGGLLFGGDSGAAVMPGDSDASLLLKVIRHEVDGLEMPEGADKLDEASISLIERWIRDGATDPRTEQPTEQSSSVALSWQAKFDKRKQWWSTQPLVAPVNAPIFISRREAVLRHRHRDLEGRMESLQTPQPNPTDHGFMSAKSER